MLRDTDSTPGRYNLQTKEIGLKDIARIHGHMCDGLVIAFVEIKAVLSKVFPDGVVDRTDLQVVSKNGPCWADAAAFLTGARINFQNPEDRRFHRRRIHHSEDINRRGLPRAFKAWCFSG